MILSDGDTVFFATGLNGTITFTSGQLVVNKSIFINGPAANVLSVSGNNASRVFMIGAGKTVAISGLTIQNGNANGNSGGAIYNDHSTLTVDSCTLSNNSADNGGAAYNDGGNGDATLTLKELHPQCEPGRRGRGRALQYRNIRRKWATLTLINSTLSGNTADSGGAIFNIGIGFPGVGTLTVSHSTFSGNSATSGNGGGIYNAGGFGSALLYICNTILKTGATGGNILNNQGTVTSAGYNLSSDNGGGFLTATGDQINTDPMLGPLQNNGGPTFTHALLQGSPALNAGDPSFNPNTFNPPLNFDQRGPGFSRVVNGRLDIGAFEGLYVIVTNTNDNGGGALRQALLDASNHHHRVRQLRRGHNHADER